jgi:Sec-independent protein translocase protein TatA
MFGISFAEFLVIAIVAMAVVPTKNWPDVFRTLAKIVKFIRGLIWKITDATESIKDRVERELPMDEIIKKTTDDVVSAFSTPKRKQIKSKKTKK